MEKSKKSKVSINANMQNIHGLVIGEDIIKY